MTQTDLIQLHEDALVAIEQQIARLFEEQKQHLACKKGCDSCCMDTFRVRYIELLYLIQGFFAAPEAVQQRILANLQNPVMKEQKRCPILIDGACGLYANRPALCRAYGLMIQLDGGLSTCQLNYRERDPKVQLNVLEMGPVYDLLNSLSDLAWEQMTGEKDVSPLMTIRQFLESVLAQELQASTSA